MLLELHLWLSHHLTAVKSYLGSVMTTIFLCDDDKAKYNEGVCAKTNEQKRAQFSLWFAYAVDVATDLAGMYVHCQRDKT